MPKQRRAERQDRSRGRGGPSTMHNGKVKVIAMAAASCTSPGVGPGPGTDVAPSRTSAHQSGRPRGEGEQFRLTFMIAA